MSGTGTARARQGDTLDAIAHRVYGGSDMTDRLWEANPGLARQGRVLPQGTLVILPPRETPIPTPQTTLW